MLLNVRSVEAFEDCGLDLSMGTESYLMQVAELFMSGAPSFLYDPKFIETDEYALLRVSGVFRSSGSSFSMFVALAGQRLYYCRIAVSKPDYVDACNAYMDVVLSQVIAPQTTISGENGIIFNIPEEHHKLETTVYDNGLEQTVYTCSLDTGESSNFGFTKIQLADWEMMTGISVDNKATRMADKMLAFIVGIDNVTYTQAQKEQIGAITVVRVSGIGAPDAGNSAELAAVYAGNWNYLLVTGVEGAGNSAYCKEQMDYVGE